MKTKTTIFGLATLVTLAIAAIAFAHGGYGSHMRGYGGYMMGPGYDGHMMGPGYGGYMMGPGYGGHMMGWDADEGPYGRGCDSWGNLSEEQEAKLRASQDKFYNETRVLRDRIEEKSLALNNEMNKTNPDQAKIFSLQKEISSLRGEFDQKAIAHRMDVRKMLPDDYRGRGYARGYCW